MHFVKDRSDAPNDGKRPKVALTINGHAWRSRIASMGGPFIAGLSNANRAASWIAKPPDLAKALNGDPEARAAFDRLPCGLKRKHRAAIDEAKTSVVRQRAIAKLVTTVR